MRKESSKARLADEKEELSFEFEWVKHQSGLIYENRLLSFKIKKESLFSSSGEETEGFEVYINDNPRQKNWRPMRFFKDQKDPSKIMKWVEHMAQRILANRF